MDATTQWLRGGTAAETWLAWIQHGLASSPEWVLLAALLLVALPLTLVLARRQGKSSKQAKSQTPLADDNERKRKTSADAPAASKAMAPSPLVSTLSSHAADTDGDDNRTVRVFISSTFIDMDDERKVLVKETFPALSTKFRARGVEFVAVDLLSLIHI